MEPTRCQGTLGRGTFAAPGRPRTFLQSHQRCEDPTALSIVHGPADPGAVGTHSSSLGPLIDGLSDENRAVASMLTTFAKLDRNRYPDTYDDEERRDQGAETRGRSRAQQSTALRVLQTCPAAARHLLWKQVARLSKIVSSRTRTSHQKHRSLDQVWSEENRKGLGPCLISIRPRASSRASREGQGWTSTWGQEGQMQLPGPQRRGEVHDDRGALGMYHTDGGRARS